MTTAPQRKRWMEPGAPPYQSPKPPRAYNPGRAAGLIVVAPILGLLSAAMISNGDISGWDVIGGAIVTGLLMVLVTPSKTRKR